MTFSSSSANALLPALLRPPPGASPLPTVDTSAKVTAQTLDSSLGTCPACGCHHNAAVILHEAQHGISRGAITTAALKVTDALQQAGFAGFIVGGAVRDLLLGRTPKDFDVATDATPEQVVALFPRARIIGRRFKIVHVYSLGELIEITTFRAALDANTHTIDADGRVLHDNHYGSQNDDALRRDFTANALYYDPNAQTIWDYCHGWADIKAHQLVMIGDPSTRYREDPVRLLRAVRLAAKLDLEIAPATRAPIESLAPLLANVPAARLFDEMLKLLLSGQARACLSALRSAGLHHGCFPLLDVCLAEPQGERFTRLALENTDARLAVGKPVSPAFLLAALLWQEVKRCSEILETAGLPAQVALTQAMDQVLDLQAEQLAIPRRFGSQMKEIWLMQPRFLSRQGKRAYRLLESPRFRAGFDFLMLRCASGELPLALGEWWETFQFAASSTREQMVRALQETSDPTPARKRRRRRRKPTVPGEEEEGTC